MANHPDAVPVLIIGEREEDLEQVQAVLKRHFKNLQAALGAQAARAALEQHSPHVIVLAFQDMQEAQPYCRAPGSSGPSLNSRRFVVLCNEAEAAAAFEMCKRQYFDDYVPFWAPGQDAARLPMSVWLACRAAIGLREHGETGAQLLAHTRHLGELDRTVSHELEIGQKQAAVAQESMVTLEQKLAQASDDFSQHLAAGAHAAVKVEDPMALSSDLARFKAQQLELTREAMDKGVQPMNDWACRLRDKVEPTLAQARPITLQARPAPSTLLVIDDDETTRGLLIPALRALNYDVVVARNGKQAQDWLLRMQPGAIIVDFSEPGSEAIAVTRHLKSSVHAHIPILIMSGDTRKETLISSIQAGAADFIAKPFTRDILRTKLSRVLRQRASA